MEETRTRAKMNIDSSVSESDLQLSACSALSVYIYIHNAKWKPTMYLSKNGGWGGGSTAKSMHCSSGRPEFSTHTSGLSGHMHSGDQPLYICTYT